MSDWATFYKPRTRDNNFRAILIVEFTRERWEGFPWQYRWAICFFSAVWPFSRLLHLETKNKQEA